MIWNKKTFHIAGILFIPLASFAQTYSYDELGRVKTVSHGEKETTYSYDSADSRTSVVTSASNNLPACSDSSVYMGGVPPTAGPVNISISQSQVLSQCSDSDGDSLTVLTPNLPYPFTISAGQTKVINFSVTDGKGDPATGKFTYQRP